MIALGGGRTSSGASGGVAAGMWLPETAVDLGTLDATWPAEGSPFTIVGDTKRWSGAPSDGRPGRVITPQWPGGFGPSSANDCPLSHGVAFGNLLRDAGAWARADGLKGGARRGEPPARGRKPPRRGQPFPPTPDPTGPPPWCPGERKRTP